MDNKTYKDYPLIIHEPKEGLINEAVFIKVDRVDSQWIMFKMLNYPLNILIYS